jgi:lipoate---protein ligase
LKIPKQKIHDKLINNVKERVVGLNRTFEEVSAALEQAFSMKFSAKLVVDKITLQECRDSQMLIETKYGTQAWNWRR